MLIVDIPRSTVSDKYIRVCVIGSCRVRDLFYEAYKVDPKPPESADAPECPVVWYRFSAFTHTIAQAHQYLRFLTGRLEIPYELQPCVLYRHVTPESRKALLTLTPELMSSIDLYVTELSTFSEFTVGDILLNASFTETHLVRAGGKPLLKWWRSVANPATEHHDIVQQTLDALPSKDVENNEVIRSVISKGYWQTRTMDQAAASLRELMDDFGKPMVIVPAFNVPNAPLESRTRLLDTLQTLAGQEGCHFFDPTTVIASAGQEIALKGGGVDFAHYEQGFHYTLIRAVVPFLQQAVASHERTGEFSSLRYQPPDGSMNVAA